MKTDLFVQYDPKTNEYNVGNKFQHEHFDKTRSKRESGVKSFASLSEATDSIKKDLANKIAFDKYIDECHNQTVSLFN